MTSKEPVLAIHIDEVTGKHNVVSALGDGGVVQEVVRGATICEVCEQLPNWALVPDVMAMKASPIHPGPPW